MYVSTGESVIVEFRADSSLQYIVPYVCAALGAENVTVADTRPRSRKATSVTPDLSGRSTSDFDYIIVLDEVPKATGKNAARTCNVEWVKQCLVRPVTDRNRNETDARIAARSWASCTRHPS